MIASRSGSSNNAAVNVNRRNGTAMIQPKLNVAQSQVQQ